MNTNDWDNLRKGDKIIAYNGVYTQHGVVAEKWRDKKGMRWVKYFWFRNGVFQNWASKRYLSVHLGET